MRSQLHSGLFAFLFVCLIEISSITSCYAQATTSDKPRFRAGVATVDISPTEFPRIVAGGFLEGRATANTDRLFVRSFVLDDGRKQLALTVVDTCMMTQQLIDEAKRQASAKCGIPTEHMLVSATHTHSAPAAMGCLGTRLDETYAATLPGKIAEAIIAAHKDLQPARIGWAAIDDWEHTHNRRWIRKPESKIVDPFGNATGRAHMHPGYQSKEVIGPSGPVDPALSVLSLQTAEGRPLGVLANYSQHYFGAKAISADYYGVFCKHMAELLHQPGDGNEKFVCAMSQGTSGDLMWMDYGSPQDPISMPQYAEAVAKFAEQALARVVYRDSAELNAVEKQLPLKYRVPDEARLAWARPIADKIENDLPKSIPEVYAREAVILHERQSTTLKLQAIRIGDMTIAALPNEVYALTGLKLKGRSPSSLHFNVELANGAEGYIPPPEQHTLGGYTTWPARTAGLEVQAETKITETLTAALEEVTGKPRRSMADTHGPYAERVLAEKPLGYWRLNDADGSEARNSVAGAAAAKLSGGFAWYLPGVGSGTGIGDREVLVPGPFSGPGQINRAVHLADGELTTEFEQLAGDYSLCCWFWGGEKSGASDRLGSLCRLPSGESLVVEQFADHTFSLKLGDQQSKRGPAADQWHMAVIVRRAGTLAVHLDGVESPLLTVAAGKQTDRAEFRFGTGYQGKLDEIALFGRAIEPSLIKQLWSLSGVDLDQRREARLSQLQTQRPDAQAAIVPAMPIRFAPEYSKHVLATKPLRYWPLDAKPTTTSVTGTIVFDEKTKTTQGAEFRGGRIADSFSSDPETYSVSMWFRNDLPTGSRPVTAYLFSRGPDGDAQAPGDHLGIGGSYRPTLVGRLMVFNGNRADQVVHGRTQLEPGSWHHVVMVRDRKRVRVWLDGNTQPEIDADLEWTAEGSRSLFVGARSDQFAPLQGAAAQVAVYDRALQTDEITSLHSKAAAKFQQADDASQAKNESSEKPDPNRPASDPLSPQESLERIHVPRGFQVELVACEPNVIDPVAFDWDAAGRLWVVEMADYPLGMDGKGKAGGRVRVLEDRDHDGKYESSKLFAEGLNFPNGILTWRDGVIVTAAPQILFLSDTDGDGVADKKNVLLDGFMEGNQQLRLNGLRWGLDGWIVCASGGHHANYGTATKIRSHVNGKSYELGSRDFRFSPDTGEVAAETGPSQFGRNRDRWGHWFGTQNANPLWQYLIDDRYLARNPHVPIAKPIHYVLPSGSPPVYPASAAEKRYHNFQQAGHFTSACSGMIYNDDLLFGRSDAQHAFTCEPFHNLVQHNLLIDDGVSYRSLRPVGEGPFDFFASEDRWCRPVMARTGPDGALWIADMYRYMIEHPDWLPPEGKSELLPHYRLGDDKGRIYRIVPAGSSLKLPEPIAKKNSQELVAALRSSNDWRRDKAQQVLLERSETGAVAELRSLLASAPLAESRLQALATLAAMKQATAADVEAGLRDRHPRVREFAVRAAEQLHTHAALDLLTAMVNEPDAKVVLQLTLSLGEWPDPSAGRTLSELACSHADDPTIVAAVLTSAMPHAQALASRLLTAEPSVADVYREPLVRMALARRDYDQLASQVSGVLSAEESSKSAGRLNSLLSVLQRLSIDLSALAQETQNVELKSAVVRLNKRLDQAAEVMQNSDAVPAERITAAALVSRVPLRRAQAVESLAQWLAPQFDVALQQQALTAMRESGDDSTPQHLASRWSELTPAVQASVMDVWMSRKGWVQDLLERLESGKMSAAGLDLNQRARLQQVPDKQIAERATKFFNRDPLQSRKEVLERFRPALQGKGDMQRGLTVYRRACASCHRRGEEGVEVGPNLATVASHAPEKLLTNILAPNADIQPGFQAYACLLTSGEVISGLLAGETAGSITIKLAGGQSRTIARSEIETLRNTNVSLMPEGLENTLSVQDVEDLIAALRAQ